MRDHERECFVSGMGVRHDQLVTHDLLEGAPRFEEVKRYDAVLMGGAGAFLVSQKNQPNIEPFLDLLRTIVDRGHPTFATCYGYQAMVQALGGEVIHDPERAEIGTFAITLTDEGATDELLGGMPHTFMAQQGHKDRATQLPANLVNLASSERCPFQALRVKDKPVWAVQFHPELTRDGNRSRYRHYLEHYSPELTEEQILVALERFDHSPESSQLLGRFLSLVFG